MKCQHEYKAPEFSSSDGYGCFYCTNDKLEAALLQVSELQNFVHRVIDQHGFNVHTDEECPEDDTCECPLATEANKLMKGFIEKPNEESPFPTAQQLKAFRAVSKFFGACEAHRMTNCQTCAEKQKSEVGVFCLEHRKVMTDGICPKCGQQ